MEFRRAHEIYPHPIFLHNVALMYKRLERFEDALEAAREVRELDDDLSPEEDARNSGIIEGAKAALHGDEMAGVVDEQSDETDVPPPVTDDSSFGTTGVTGVGSLALGIAGLVGGTVIHYRLESNRDEFEQRYRRNPDSEAVAELDDRISSQELQRTTLFIAGAGLSVLGASLIVIGARSGSPNSGVALSIPVDRPGLSASYRW